MALKAERSPDAVTVTLGEAVNRVSGISCDTQGTVVVGTGIVPVQLACQVDVLQTGFGMRVIGPGLELGVFGCGDDCQNLDDRYDDQ